MRQRRTPIPKSTADAGTNAKPSAGEAKPVKLLSDSNPYIARVVRDASVHAHSAALSGSKSHTVQPRRQTRASSPWIGGFAAIGRCRPGGSLASRLRTSAPPPSGVRAAAIESSWTSRPTKSDVVESLMADLRNEVSRVLARCGTGRKADPREYRRPASSRRGHQVQVGEKAPSTKENVMAIEGTVILAASA